MQKIRYEIDPHNRLTKRGPNKFRQVIDGTFKLADGNVLAYHVKKSDNVDVPQEIRFSGDWSLDKNHDLTLTLDKWNNQIEGNKLVLKSELLSANGDELVFSVTSRSDLGPEQRGRTSGSERVCMLRFGGSWQADAHNRLTFQAEKKTGSVDPLVLQGRWEINKQNEIVYVYPENTITLRGHWQITDKNKLSYVLNDRLGSRLDFTAGFERAENNSLRYGITIGYGKRKRTIALFGKWKIDKRTGLFFEVKHTLAGIKIGAELSRSFLAGRGEGFIKTLISRKETAILCGMGFKW